VLRIAPLIGPDGRPSSPLFEPSLDGPPCLGFDPLWQSCTGRRGARASLAVLYDARGVFTSWAAVLPLRTVTQLLGAARCRCRLVRVGRHRGLVAKPIRRSPLFSTIQYCVADGALAKKELGSTRSTPAVKRWIDYAQRPTPSHVKLLSETPA